MNRLVVWLAVAVAWFATASTLPAQKESAPPAPVPAPGALKSDDDIQTKIDKDEDNAYANIALIARALQLIRQDYVDGKKITYRDLTYGALRGMLNALDPHSQFMEPEIFKEMQDDTRSRYDGLGLVVSTRDGQLTVVTSMDGGPAAKAGLLTGDLIVKINGQATEKMQVSDAVSMLKGKPNDKITLTILRPANREVKDFVLTRTEIKVDSVKDVRMLTTEPNGGGYKIGFIRITQFNEPTADDLVKKLDELQKAGMNALVLDLRNNPGGLLNSAVDVCAQFVAPGTMVCYTDGRAPSANRIYRTPTNSKPRLDFPIAVLINNGSASGAEIVAGALKDLNRAILVGERTFGKGSVQSVIQMPDNSALRLTTAKYFTPSRQVIHERGIEPNIRSVLSPEQERALVIRRNSDTLTEVERHEADGIKDPQLDRAVDALKGMMIYRQQMASKAKTPLRGKLEVRNSKLEENSKFEIGLNS